MWEMLRIVSTAIPMLSPVLLSVLWPLAPHAWGGECSFCQPCTTSDDDNYGLVGCGKTIDPGNERIGVSRYGLHVATSGTDQYSRSYSLSKLATFRKILKIKKSQDILYPYYQISTIPRRTRRSLFEPHRLLRDLRSGKFGQNRDFFACGALY